jgi:putative membrane protein
MELLFSCAGSIVPAIFPRICVAALLGCVAAWLRVESSGGWADELTRFEFAPFTAVGVAISLFLGFRNNASYDRWWEGRRQWGAQLIAVRNFARLLSVLKVSAGERRALVRLTAAHSHALRAQLRATWSAGSGLGSMGGEDDDPLAKRDSFLEPEEKASLAGKLNPADAILGMASVRLGALHTPLLPSVAGAQGQAGGNDSGAGALDSYSVVAASQLLDVLGQVQGACERIATTPLPFPYVLLVHRTALAWVVLAPFAMGKTTFSFDADTNCY